MTAEDLRRIAANVHDGCSPGCTCATCEAAAALRAVVPLAEHVEHKRIEHGGARQVRCSCDQCVVARAFLAVEVPRG